MWFCPRHLILLMVGLINDDIVIRVRKGRNSVEEIILDSIALAVGVDEKNLKMHGCGREDIDVRMLGDTLCCGVIINAYCTKYVNKISYGRKWAAICSRMF